MSSLETIADERLETERAEGRAVIKATLTGAVFGAVFGTGATSLLLLEYTPGNYAALTVALVAGSVAVGARLTYLIYRYSEDWLLERAVEHGYIDTEDTA